MTDTTPTAASIAAGLSESEREALKAVAKAQGYPGAKALYERLDELKLITFRQTDNSCKMLSLGWKVLAALKAAEGAE